MRATDRKRPPPCITCTADRDVSPHRASYEVRDGDTGLVISYTCDRGIVGVLARVLLVLLTVALFACSDSSGASDAGELEHERDASHIANLIDAAGDGDGDAGQLEHDAGDGDGDGDAGQLEHDAGDGDGDAGQLEHDAGEPLRACTSASELRLCRSADCGAELCRSATSMFCCDREPGSAPHCACEAP